MRIGIRILIAILVVVAFMGCIKVPPGNVGIRVNLLGDDKGDMQTYKTGRYGKGFNKSWYMFPTFNQSYVWTKNPAESSPNDESFDFPISGLTVGLDLGIEYSLEPDRILDIFVTYQKGVLELTDIIIRNRVRDALNRHSKDYDMDALVEGGLDKLMGAVEKTVREQFEV